MAAIEKLPEVVRPNDVTVAGEQSPLQMYEIALSHGADMEHLERMLAFQEKYDAILAKKAYTKAMAAFKADPLKITKDQNVSFGKTKYSHASLGNVTHKINKSLALQGLSSGWRTEQGASGITVTCTITHILGHGESTSLTAPADNTGGKNSIQALGSAITYLERYTLLALTGLATHDDDGQSADIQYITEKQASIITDLMNEHINPDDHAGFLSWANIESIEFILAQNFNSVISAIKAAS